MRQRAIVKKILQILFSNVYNLIPKRYQRILFKTLAFDNFDFYTQCHQILLHEKWSLYASRFNKGTIAEAIKRAKARFPEAIFYALTDIEQNDLPIKLADFKLHYISDLKLVENNQKTKVFVCLFENDENYLTHISQIKKIPNAFYYTPRSFIPTSRYFHRNPIAKEVLKSEAEIKAFGSFDLADADGLLQAIDLTSNLDGNYVEIGVYRGRSAHLALEYMQKIGLHKTCYFLDLFEGFEYDEATFSQDATWKGRFENVTLALVRDHLSKYNNAKVIKHDIIVDLLPEDIKSVSMCNIDVSIFDATLAALQKIGPLVVPGGLIVAEDQGHTPLAAGAFCALNEFLGSEMGQTFLPIHMGSGQAFLIKME